MSGEAQVLDRRAFLAGTVTATTWGAIGGLQCFAESSQAPPYTICAFEKFLQDWSYDQLADTIADIGFAGIEATVRQGGHVPPERVEEELPKLTDALQKRGLEVTTITTDVLTPDQPLTLPVLRTAAHLGIKSYRMGSYKYDLKRPVIPQLESIRPGMEELAALNRELGIQGLYQNHSAPKNMGATVWDLYLLIKDFDPAEIGCAFDIRHATIEAGLSWPILYDVIKPHIGMLYVKDFDWDGKKAKHVPLGTGRVDPKFFAMIRRDQIHVPISVHVEYLPDGSAQENSEALRRDLQVLRGWLS